MKPQRQRGMTLIELLVAMVIGLGLTLAVATLLVAGENHKRTTTSTNDAEQTGAYAFYALDRTLRSAGSAIAESAYSTDAGVLGCNLNMGASYLPRNSAFPVPFAGVLGGAASTLRVAPVLIAQGQSQSTTSDVLIVMGGSGTAGGVSRPLISAGTATALNLESAEGFAAYDLVLLSQSGAGLGADCLLEEVASSQPATAPPAPLPLGGAGYAYYTANGTATTLATLSASTATYVTDLGNVNANDIQYQLIGVGTNNTLYSYDLLRNQSLVQNPGATDASQAIADGVVQMNAIYGIATTATPGIFNHWANPSTSPYDITSVMGNEATMKSIISVRVGVVVRGEYYDKNIVSPATLTYFNGSCSGGLCDGNNASLQKTVSLTPTQRHYRYRVFEFTVPLRNMLILAGTS